MRSCPNCQTAISKNETSCRFCHNVLGKDSKTMVALDLAPSITNLEKAYLACLQRANTALEAGALEDSARFFREAIRQSRLLEKPESKEIEARKLLAKVLEKLEKIPEAADQYRIIAQETLEPEMKEAWLKRSQDLIASSAVSFESLFKKEEFRNLKDEEVRYVPLYCAGCKRLFSEIEIHSFRHGESTTVPCWCNRDDRPLAKENDQHRLALKQRKINQSQRAQALEIASRIMPGGKNRTTACVLAVTLGWCGTHKFYLGETVAGWIYLFWFWTLIPCILSLYEALVLSQLSMVTFNMTYNLDLILLQSLPQETERTSTTDLFSLDTNET